MIEKIEETAGLKIVKGLVINKSTFKDKNGKVNYNLHVAMPGASVNIQVGVSQERYEKATLMEQYNHYLSVSEYRGNTYYSEI